MYDMKKEQPQNPERYLKNLRVNPQNPSIDINQQGQSQLHGTFASPPDHVQLLVTRATELYNYNSYDEYVRRFKDDLPALVIYSMVYPFSQILGDEKFQQEDEDGITGQDVINSLNTPRELSPFIKNWDSSLEMFDVDRISFRMMMLSEMSIKVLRSFYKHNINIPMTSIWARNCELQEMKSVGVVAEGEFMMHYMSDIKNMFSFAPGHKHRYLDMGMYSGSAILDKDKFAIQEHAFGGIFIGGSGTGYQVDLYDLTNLRLGNTKLDTDQQIMMMRANCIKGDVVRNNSNLSILAPYHVARNPRVVPEHFDLCGFWNHAEYATRIHATMDFQRRDKPMYPGAAFMNFLWRFNKQKPLPDTMTLEEMSFSRVNAHRRYSTVVHRVTKRHWNFFNRYVITNSKHPWGSMLPKCRKIIQSLSRPAVTDY
jgi:hypothetical protein